MEFFSEKVRRIAYLRMYGRTVEEILKQVEATETELRLLVACADLFIDYSPFDPPKRTEPISPVSGEFTAR
jgi:hypothetical protein